MPQADICTALIYTSQVRKILFFAFLIQSRELTKDLHLTLHSSDHSQCHTGRGGENNRLHVDSPGGGGYGKNWEHIHIHLIAGTEPKTHKLLLLLGKYRPMVKAVSAGVTDCFANCDAKRSYKPIGYFLIFVFH